MNGQAPTRQYIRTHYRTEKGCVHIARTLETLVVELDVGVQLLISRLKVLLVRRPAFQHFLRAEIYEVALISSQTGKR